MAMDTATMNELYALGSRWIAEHRLPGAPRDILVDEDTDLVEHAVIDSLAFVELIHFLEGETGGELDVDRLDMGELTLRTLCACISSPPPSVGSSPA